MSLNESKTTSDAPSLMLIARVLWYLLGGAALGRALLVNSHRHRGIYDIYALAGRNWLAGNNVYVAKDGFQAFRYAPLVAAALTPLAHLPDMLGSFLFRGANLIVFMLGAYAFLDRVVQARRGSQGEAIYWLVLAPLAMSGLLDLQVNALTTGLMLLAVAALPQARWNFVAICLTGAILLKVYPIALMLLCILMWPRELAWRFAAALLAGLALPFLMQHPEFVLNQYHRWFHLMSVNERQHLPIAEWYRDIRLPLGMLGFHMVPIAYLILQAAVAAMVAIIIIGLRRGENDWRLQMGILYGLAVGWMMAFGPATEGVTYIMLAPAVAWLVVDAVSETHSQLWRISVMALAMIFIGAEVSLWFPFGRPFRSLGPQPVGAVLLMMMLTLLRFDKSSHVRGFSVVIENPSIA